MPRKYSWLPFYGAALYPKLYFYVFSNMVGAYTGAYTGEYTKMKLHLLW